VKNSAEWCRILISCHVKPDVAVKWAEVFADTVRDSTFRSDQDLTDFLGQVLHESAGLTHMVEQMDYSPERLCVVWPKRFPTLNDARPYAHNPEALANRVYGGRMGNTRPGDGWLYRARSPIGITGHDNYVVIGDVVGQDLETMPELMEQPHFALEATIAWWQDRIPDSILGDPEKITIRVNGGLIGLADREELMAAAARAIA
jgi:putative chitinase